MGRWVQGLSFIFAAMALLACGDDGPAATDAGTQDTVTTDADSDAVAEDSGPDVPVVDCSTRPADAPETRGEVAGVLDEAKGRLLVYGGNAAAPIECRPMFDIVSELWAFHLDCNNWEQLTVTGGPDARARHGAVLDSANGRMLVFGGRLRMDTGVYQNFNDVWAFDLVSDTWEQLVTTGTAPSPRSSPVVAVDEANNRMIVAGGNDSTSGLEFGPLSDTFALDLSTLTWTEIPGEGPPARVLQGGTILGSDLFIFGGTTGFSAGFLNDTWAFNLNDNTWRMVAGGRSHLAGDPFRSRAIRR